MKNTREKILRTLLSYPESTIQYLADSVGINGISIRHHLSFLEAEGLVRSTEERHGVGRPRLIYSLTDKGIEKFPTSYLKLIRRIIDSLKEKMTEDEITALFEGIGADIADTHQDDSDHKSLEQKLQALKSLMSSEGFIVEYEKVNDGYLIKSLSCPYYQIGLDYPEICTLDHKLVTEFLSFPVEINSCMLKGDAHCSYTIQIEEK